jgi:charged multivesicular body protein 3
VNEWCRKIRKESSQLDRQIRGIEREEEKVKRSLREAAKKGDKDVCLVLAKEVMRARKAIRKIHTSKAHLNSVQMQMKNQLATVRVSGALKKSTEVMASMQSLIRVPEVAATMRDMSREMMKAGIIEEMLEETFEGLEDQDELEEEAQEEVDKVRTFYLKKMCVNFALLAGLVGGDPRAAGQSARHGHGHSAGSQGA